MKILLLSTEEFSGAGKATNKIKCALNKLNIVCDHKVLFKNKKNLNLNDKIRILIYKLKIKLYSFMGKVSGKNRNDFQSLSIFPTNLSNEINKSDYDIIHLTWINELLNIEDIGRIKKPIVWTLCDMWPIAGINHYEGYNLDTFWRFKNFTTFNFKKFDLDKWIIDRKIKSWKNKIIFVSPSQWLYNCAKDSVISNKFQIEKISWPIDKNIFSKLDKKKMRNRYNLPINKKIILFNSFSGIYSKRKGSDLFFNALKRTKLEFDVLIIGNHLDKNIDNQIHRKIHWMGRFDNEFKLAELINCADLLVLPSRMDNLPQTGLEAQACGLPVVAFNTNGIKDLIDHKIDGYLSEPFDVDSLKDGIEWTINELNLSSKLSTNSLKKSNEKWDSNIVAQKYKNLYQEILNPIK